jgi:hypothetical protein
VLIPLDEVERELKYLARELSYPASLWISASLQRLRHLTTKGGNQHGIRNLDGPLRLCEDPTDGADREHLD